MRGRLLIVVVGQLADRARNGDGESSGGIVIAEDDVGHGGPAFLAEIPAIENRGNMLSDEVDGIRPAMLEEDDGGLAGGEDGFGEIILIAEEVKIVAVAGMIDGPASREVCSLPPSARMTTSALRATATASSMRLALSAGSPSTTLSAFQSGSDSVILQPSA